MDLNGLFKSPANHLSVFAEMQAHLYRHDTSLQDYFLPLQLDMLSKPQGNTDGERTSNPLVAWVLRSADGISKLSYRQKIKTDVLFCPMPYFSRKTENIFLTRSLLGLAETGAKILCLLPSSSPLHDELDAQLESAGRTGQVDFLDPATSLNRIEARTRARMSKIRGSLAYERAVSILEPYQLKPGRAAKAGFEQIAHFVEAWERLAPRIEFDSVVTRCHWHALCSPVCRTARERGKPVITFQQGVIGHTLDVPVTASKYVSFGRSSASFLEKANKRFFQAAGMPETSTEYVHGGCLYDTITPLPSQFDQRSLLIVDVPMAQDDFYGTESQCQALLQLAEKLLASPLPLRRIIIRPHPYWSNLDFEACQRLAREYSTRCELSHPAWSLEDDMRRSSAVVGIFSGVLTVAAACGLPTVFLETEDGYQTGDLACFSPHQTLLPNAAFFQIGRLVTDRNAYAEAREEALQNAREYYEDGANVNLDAKFFSGLLRTRSLTNEPQAEIK